MAHNEILDELHAARRKILEDYNGDTAAYLRDAKARLGIFGAAYLAGQAANNPLHRNGEFRRFAS